MPLKKNVNFSVKGKIPIVIFIHKRTHHLRKVLRAVQFYRPTRIFIFGDGWAPGDEKEEAACRKARALVGRAVNWPCRRFLFYSHRKLGLKTSVERGLSQLFAKVPEAIILEDDCVATPAFFKFCEENLRKYRRDPMVMSISGSCFVEESVPISGRAYLSKYPHCWGWATWARAWRKYRGAISPGALRKILDRQRFPKPEQEYWSRVAVQLAGKKMSSWAYFWLWAHWSHGGRALSPAVNLVRNIGFDSTARHTRELAKPLLVRTGNPSLVFQGPILSIPESENLDRSVFRSHYRRMAGRRGWREKITDRLRLLLPGWTRGGG